MPRHKKPGRKPLDRERRQVYLSKPSVASIEEWRVANRFRLKTMSFSSAVNEMIGVASYYAADVGMSDRLRSARDVLTGLSDIPPHIGIDSNTGRRLYCRVCRKRHQIASRRFRGIVKSIAKFVAEHRHESACDE